MKRSGSMVCGVLWLAWVVGWERPVMAGPGAGLGDYGIRVWGKAQGLPDASVTAVLQARDGYLWVGTGAGLVRFDGLQFTVAPLPVPGDPASVSITALCEDGAGRLWIGSRQQGLWCLVDGQARRYGKSDGLLDDGVTSLTIDARDHLWIGTRRGVNRWNGRAFSAFTRREGLPDDFVSGVHAARSGALLITTRAGMCRLVNDRIAPFELEMAGQSRNPEFLGAYEDVRGNLWAFGATYLINLAERKRFNYFHGEEPASTRLWSFCEGRDGRLWIGTSGRGLFCFDGQRFQPVMLSEVRRPNDVRAICEDTEGNLWLGISGGGLVQLRPQGFTLLKSNQGLPPGAATCLTLDPVGRVYVGLESSGLFVGAGQRFEKFSDRTGLVGQDAESVLCAAVDGSVWVGTSGNGLYWVKGGRAASITTANGLSDNCILAMGQTADGAMWIGTRAGALHRFKDEAWTTFDQADGLPGTPVTVLLPSREGGLWMGTRTGSVRRFYRNSFQPISLARELADKSILSLYEDAAGRVWIGTAGGGLGCWQGQNCLAWGMRDGLPDEVISGVLDDAEGNLWLVTGQGVYRISQASIADALAGRGRLRTKLVFEYEPGPNQGLALTGLQALRTPEGPLWFATPSGLLTVNSRDWESARPAPPVRLEAVLVNNQRLRSWTGERTPSAAPHGAPLRLPAQVRTLEIQFTALSFYAPEKVRFRHKLDGFDAEWVESGMERRVRYGQLPGGHYEFHLAACNADGIWNEADAPLAFLVPIPLWRNPWMLGLFGLTATGGIIRVVRLVSHRRLLRRLQRLEQEQAMERERMRIAQDMHDEIGSKLTKISFLSEMAKAESPDAGPGGGKIDSIAVTSRELLQALDEIVWAVNPRNDTLEHLAAYLAQYATEYFQNTALECELHLPSQLPAQTMSAETRHSLFLAFKESLNNVLKHAQASRVRIDIQTIGTQFQVRVTDNGRGFTPAPAAATSPDPPHPKTRSGGNGLPNIHRRLAGLGGRCDLRSSPGQGTVVSLTINVIPDPHHPV